MKNVFVLSLVFLCLTVGIALGDEVTLTPTADSPVFGYNPGTNYGGQSYGYWGYYNAPMRTLVKYNLTSVVGTVTAVKLSFQLQQNNWSGTTIWACKLQGDWAEMTVTYANQPAHDTSAAGIFLTATAPSGLGPFTLDCTAAAVTIVQSWISTPATNYGIILRTETEGSSLRAYPYMRESSSQPVRLVVTYTPGSAIAPASLGRVKTLFR